MFADFNDIMRSSFALDDCPRIGPFTYHNGVDDEDYDEFARATRPYGGLPTSAVRRPLDPTAAAVAATQPSTGELITRDPLDSSTSLGSSSGPTAERRCWKLAASCPVPRAIPKLDHKKGTTTLAFSFDGGIIVAVDSRASTGQYIASQTVMKVLEINEYLLGTLAGGAADCQYWERVLGMECRLWELRNGSRITTAAASKILANITYAYRNHGLSMGTMVAGWDKFGPAVYYVDDKGSRVKQNLFSVGSGSIYAYGVLDTGYRKDLSVEDAIDLARKAIFHATYRDGASGGIVTVYHIKQGGWTQISRDDQTKLFHRYFPNNN